MSLEALTPELREHAVRYQRLVAPGSVLVGVVLGAAEWDIRPVLLQRGIMTITRMFSPELLGSIQLSDAFKSYVFHVERLAPGLQSFNCGSGDGYAWVTRRYFNTLLSDPALQLPLNEKISLIGALLSDIEALQTGNIVHGHIHPANIAYEEGKLVLIDHGFQIHDPSASHPPTLAPELRSGVAGQLNASPASDMYGLGLVAKRLFGSELGLEFGNLIEVLLLSDPKLRPKLAQITGHFVRGDSKVSAAPARPAGPEPAEREKKPSKFLSFYLPATLAIFIGCALLSFPIRAMFKSGGSPEILQKYEKYWDSGQAPLMQQVVSASLNGSAEARDLVFEKIASGANHPSIQRRLFDVALNPLWADELSDSDRDALITLGLTSLIPADKRTLPELSKLHPAVVLSIVGNMAVDAAFDPLAKVSLRSMARLPSPYGPAFGALEKTGVQALNDPAAQALSHIVTEDVSQEIVRAFLGGADPSLSLAKLQILVRLMDIFDGLDKKVYEAASAMSENGLYTWFAKDLVAQWGSRQPREKLMLFLGIIPPNLNREQQLDLLRFPRSNIREKALELLKAGRQMVAPGLLQYLASPECVLTRTQSISLISALGVESDSAHRFILQWFDTAPDPSGVLKVLIETGTDPKLQAFHIEAARYLLDKQWKITMEELSRLAGSVEPLARTLAYSRLRVDVPEEREIIRKLAGIEPIERIKNQLLERLGSD